MAGRTLAAGCTVRCRHSYYSCSAAMATVVVAAPGVPTARWAFDETSGTVANDAVGSVDGVIAGATSVADGQVGRAFHFDGSDRVTIPDAASQRGLQVTVDLWLRGDPDAPPDLFDPPGRRGAPAQVARRQMVEAILFLARTGCQWRYLPERYGPWTAVWAQWRRWRANGVWARAMARLAVVVRLFHDREPLPSMVMVDAQTVKGGRYGPTFHEAGGRGGRTIGTKRTLLVEILGLPLAAHAGSAWPHDVSAARELLRDRLADLPRVRAIVGDRAYRGLARLAERKHIRLDIKAPPAGVSGFVPIRPLYRIEHVFAQLGRWRRLSRCYEGSEASARAWLEVASVGYLAWRAVA